MPRDADRPADLPAAARRRPGTTAARPRPDLLADAVVRVGARAAARPATSSSCRRATKFGAANAVIWSSRTLTTPAASVPISLPWITGNPASLYWHVRAWCGRCRVGLERASALQHALARRSNRDCHDDARRPAAVRASPGTSAGRRSRARPATRSGTRTSASTQSAWQDLSTITTVADEREFYTLRDAVGGTSSGAFAQGARSTARRQQLPRASRTARGARSTTAYRRRGASSADDGLVERRSKTVVGPASCPTAVVREHALMPVFVFSRDGHAYHRVYVATDKDCVNVVHGLPRRRHGIRAARHGPARSRPGDVATRDARRSSSTASEGKTLRSDGEAMTSNEALPEADAATGGAAHGVGRTTTAESGPPAVDLWDTDWEPAGTTGPSFRSRSTAAESTERSRRIDRRRTASPAMSCRNDPPQDACQAARALFGKQAPSRSSSRRRAVCHRAVADWSAPVGVELAEPFYGVRSSRGRPRAARPATTSSGARTRYPWRTAGALQTPATSALLPLQPGTWCYRVRGNNPYLTGNKKILVRPGADRDRQADLQRHRRLGSRVRRLATSEEGFGLVELLIAMLVMAIGIMAIVAGFSSGIVARQPCEAAPRPPARSPTSRWRATARRSFTSAADRRCRLRPRRRARTAVTYWMQVDGCLDVRRAGRTPTGRSAGCARALRRAARSSS